MIQRENPVRFLLACSSSSLDPELTAKPYLQQQRRGSKLKVHPGAVEPHVSGSTVSFPVSFYCDLDFLHCAMSFIPLCA